MNEVYHLEYTDSVYDGWMTISIHKTKKGAYLAMRKHITELYMDWYNDRLTYGKYTSLRGIDKFQAQYIITTITLKD